VLFLALQAVGTPASAQTFEELKALNEAVVRDIERLNRDNEKRLQEYKDAAVLADRAELLGDYLRQLRKLIERQQAETAELQARVQQAAQRHSQWVAKLRAQIDTSIPDWQAIIDLVSYRRALERIADFEQRIADDAALSASERDLVGQLRGFDSAALAGALNELLRVDAVRLVLAERPDKATVAHASLNQIQNQLREFARQQVVQQTMLRSFQLARTRLRAAVPQVWRALARKVLQQANVAIANDFTGMYTRELNSPRVYFGAMHQIDSAQRKISYHLSETYSPRLALREARTLGVLAADMKRNLPNLSVTEPTRRQVELIVLRGEAAAKNYTAHLETLGDPQRRMYADMRALMVKWSTMGLGPKISSHCKTLAERASQAGTSMDAEVAYQEYVRQCDVN
jgi:hypothetical protein